VGPHFESLCRSFAQQAGERLFGSPVGEVGAGVVNDPAGKTQLEIDVAVFAPAEAGKPRRVISIGEVKWGQVMGRQHVDRLRRARDLLAATHDTTDCVLTCYSAAGFDGDLRSVDDTRLALIGIEDLYG
jgi:hypothetical protein